MTSFESHKPRTIEQAISELASAGTRLNDMDASEGAAGNLSVFLRGPVEPPPDFSQSEPYELPLAVPQLAGGWLIVTGSGTRSREIGDARDACLGCLFVESGGTAARLWHGRNRKFKRITSELNSHLIVHRDRVEGAGLHFHAVVHAQPRKLTYLTHLARYRDERELNRRLLRWQPEGILNFPHGVALVPFLIPSGRELMLSTGAALKERPLAVWTQHGVIARSDVSVLNAVDLIEYVETAAAYECLDRVMGGEGEGLSPEQLAQVCAAYNVKQSVF
ncbi:MAG: class II aldolase/adducin family protein [Myxococcales bacterium]